MSWMHKQEAGKAWSMFPGWQSKPRSVFPCLCMQHCPGTEDAPSLMLLHSHAHPYPFPFGVCPVAPAPQALGELGLSGCLQHWGAGE